MPFTLNREFTQGPQDDQMWRFHVARTREGFANETSYVLVSHELVAQIYDDVMDGLPGSGLELDDVLQNWDALESHLRDEIEMVLPPEDQL